MAGRRVGAVQVTNHPPTAVKPRQDGKGTCARGGIDAHRNIMARAGDTALFDLGDLWPGGPGTRLGVDAGLLGRHRVVRWEAQSVELLHDLLSLGIKWHIVPLLPMRVAHGLGLYSTRVCGGPQVLANDLLPLELISS